MVKIRTRTRRRRSSQEFEKVWTRIYRIQGCPGSYGSCAIWCAEMTLSRASAAVDWVPLFAGRKGLVKRREISVLVLVLVSFYRCFQGWLVCLLFRGPDSGTDRDRPTVHASGSLCSVFRCAVCAV